jgi:DNA-binding NarL/FixJ family response regulator
MIRVLVVDDHAFLRESLAFQLGKLERPVDLATVADAESALITIKECQRIDLVLLDLALPDMDGFACLAAIKKAKPSCHVAILSAYDDNATICRAKAGGASGFISKRLTSEELLVAITRITEGHEFWTEPLPIDSFGTAEIHRISPPIKGNGLEARDYGLTERQMDLLNLLSSGSTNREIGKRLGISEGTVKSHFNAIFKALGVSSRAQALAAVGHYKIKVKANSRQTKVKPT